MKDFLDRVLVYYRLNKDSVPVFLVVSVPSFSHSYNSYEILKICDNATFRGQGWVFIVRGSVNWAVFFVKLSLRKPKTPLSTAKFVRSPHVLTTYILEFIYRITF